MTGLHKLKVDNGIFLDEKGLYGIREYSVVHNEEDDQATLTIKMDVTILGVSQADNDMATRVNLTPTKIADGYTECDVRLEAGQKKYVSERIVNIAELESYIEKAYVSVELLAKEMNEEGVNNQQIIRLIKDVREVLEKATNFEFCIERRITQ